MGSVEDDAEDDADGDASVDASEGDGDFKFVVGIKYVVIVSIYIYKLLFLITST